MKLIKKELMKKDNIKINFIHETDGRIRAIVKHLHEDGSLTVSLYPPQDCTIEEMWLTVFSALFPNINFIVEEEYIEEDDTNE